MSDGGFDYGERKEDGGFDYGERKEDGQYENHPTIDDGEFVQAVQREYVHEECGETTVMGSEIAESVARDPHYYTETFCAGCSDYFPVEEFQWKSDDQPWVRDDE